MKKLFLCILTAIVFLCTAPSAMAILLENGEFDGGLEGWSSSGDVTLGENSGNYFAVLGRNTSDDNSYLYQDFFIPENTPEVKVSYQLRISGFDHGADWWSDDAVDAYLRTLNEYQGNYLTWYWYDYDFLTSWDSSEGPLDLVIDVSARVDISSTLSDNDPNARMMFALFENEGYYSDLTRTKLFVDNVSVDPVPEPGTIVLMGLGLVGLAGMGRKKYFKK